MKKLFTFEEWKKENSKEYIFDNDLLYETYFYWEDLDDKEARLRQKWIESRRRRLATGDHTKEITKLNSRITSLVADLRVRIDQTLLKNRKHPVFGSNYRFYRPEEFLADAELEFHKIKKFLENSSEKIQQDPEIGFRYQELIDLLKRKVVIERALPRFGAEHIEAGAVKDLGEDEAENEEEDEEEPISQAQNQFAKIFKTVVNQESFVDTKDATKMNDQFSKAKDKIVSQFESILQRGKAAKKTANKGVDRRQKGATKKIEPPKTKK